MSPLVVVPKKNGNWFICIDYRELNRTTPKDHFPLPFINKVLDTLSRKKLFPFLDGFSGYNKIQIDLEDQEKTTFTYPWGTFQYHALPFRLCNALRKSSEVTGYYNSRYSSILTKKEWEVVYYSMNLKVYISYN